MMESLFAPLDLYCERLAPGLAGEPLNALSNLSFFFAAWLLSRRAQGRDEKQFTALIALIGLGSLSFHTFANRLTSFLDVAFIGLFILTFLYRLLRRAYGLTPRRAALGLPVFLALVALMSAAALPIPGVYLASLLMLLGFSVHLTKRAHPAACPMRKAAALFTLSLAFRTLDLPLCGAFPAGLHFLWHAVNGAVLYFVVKSLFACRTKVE